MLTCEDAALRFTFWLLGPNKHRCTRRRPFYVQCVRPRVTQVFTEHGEVLSTRVYRGTEPDPDSADFGASPCGVDVVSVGGTTAVLSLEAHEVETIWVAASGHDVSQPGLMRSKSLLNALTTDRSAAERANGDAGSSGALGSGSLNLADINKLEAMLPGVLGSLMENSILHSEQQMPVG